MTKDDILTAVRLMRLKPTDLLKLREHKYQDIQDALGPMLENGEIILSSERILEVPQSKIVYEMSWEEQMSRYGEPL